MNYKKIFIIKRLTYHDGFDTLTLLFKSDGAYRYINWKFTINEIEKLI